MRRDGRHARIINVSSIFGHLGSSLFRLSAYAASKGGIENLTRQLAVEWAAEGITVNAIAPGAATPMTETIRTDERFRDKYLERIPLGYWAQPEEIAPVFVSLASDGASYVTGQIVAADGGMTIR